MKPENVVLPVLGSAFVCLLAANAASACGTIVCIKGAFNDWCHVITIRTSPSILEVNVDGITFSAPTTSPAGSCGIGAGVPGGSIVNLIGVEIRDLDGSPFPGFGTFLPNRVTAGVFSERIKGLPLRWAGFQAPITRIEGGMR